MATKTWAAAESLTPQTWDNAAGWSPQGVPGAGDDVLLGAGTQIGIYAGSVQIASVTLGDPSTILVVNSGLSLSASSGVTLAAGMLDLRGALTNSTLRPRGGTLASGSTLDNVTVIGTLDDSAPASVLKIAGNVTLAPAAGQPGLRLTGAGSRLVATFPITAPPPSPVGFHYGSGILDGGIVLAGSSDPSQPTVLDFGTGLRLGVNLTLDVVGSTAIYGGSGDPGPYNTEPFIHIGGPINVAPGGSLSVGGVFGGVGAIHVASSTLDLSGAIIDPSLTVQMDDGVAKLVPSGGNRLTLEGFRAGDTLDFKAGYGRSFSGTFQAQLSGDQLQVVQGGQVVESITLAGQTAPGASYQATLNGPSDILVTTTAQPAATAAFTDQTTGAAGSHALDAASGGPSYLQWQYLDAGSDTVAMSAGVPNVFLKGGAGSKALAVTSGQNVLDGGTGSGFLVGGSGTDTFFVDVRGAGAVWDTLANFHAGDAVTVWGWSPGSGTERWDALDGAPGYQGATLRLAGSQGGAVSSVTFAGISADQAAHLQMATGTAGGLDYLYIANPGV